MFVHVPGSSTTGEHDKFCTDCVLVDDDGTSQSTRHAFVEGESSLTVGAVNYDSLFVFD